MKINFSEVLASKLEERGIKATKVLQDTGVKKMSISNYLNGLAIPTMTNLVKLAQYFNISLDELVYGEQLITKEYIDAMLESGDFKFSTAFLCGDDDEFKVKRYNFGSINIEMTLLDTKVHQIELFVTVDNDLDNDILVNKPTINNLIQLDRMFNTPKA